MRYRSGRRHRTGRPWGKLAFTAESATYRLINTVAKNYADRPGGYTRIIKLPDRRIGDGGELAMLQFVGDEEGPGAVTKPGRSARQRRAGARYALAVKLTRKTRADERPASKEEEPASDQQAASEEQSGPAEAGE